MVTDWIAEAPSQPMVILCIYRRLEDTGVHSNSSSENSLRQLHLITSLSYIALVDADEIYPDSDGASKLAEMLKTLILPDVDALHVDVDLTSLLRGTPAV